MDRRKFLLGASALGVASCAKPERQLLDDYEGVDFVLEAGPPRPEPTIAEQATDDGEPSSATDETLEVVEVAESPYPVDVPAEDLPGISFVAQAVVASVVAHQTPGGTDATWEFSNPIPSGGPLVFLLDEFDEHNNYRVLLPTRPNGSFGWINADDVTLVRHNFSIRVDLDRFFLTVFDHEELIFQTTVGVARDNAPTPQGKYYTTELLKPTTPSSVYGPFAYGLSGYSDTFTSFNGGPGQLGIHGTNDPETLGTNVSSGCIRMHNNDITHLVETVGLPTGVPVIVT